MPATNADHINADLLAFFKGAATTASAQPRKRELAFLQCGNAVGDVAVFNVCGIDLAETIERR
jgi:hypothetical protein